MSDKHACQVTHPQIAEGCCPWCDQVISDGQLSYSQADVTEIRWNWQAIENSLRKGAAESRVLTVGNLEDLAATIECVLPLLSLALADGDREVRAQAERVCGMIGRDLSSTQVRWLEESTDSHNDAAAARIMLLGSYFLNKQEAARNRRASHIYWLIKHHPELDVAGSPDANVFKREEPVLYERANTLWLEQVERHRSNAAVIGNAAKFFVLNDPPTAERLFREAQALEPANPKWHELLAHLYSLGAKHGAEAKRNDKARRALVELEMAEQIRVAHGGVLSTEIAASLETLQRLHALPERAMAAFEAGEFEFARQFAHECLALATGTELDEFFRNDGNAIHKSHLILGRLAMRDGNLNLAKTHLIESGKTTGSPQLNSFGPNMSLAKDLIEQGEQNVVLEYFDLCAKFWERGADRLAAWKDQLAQGRIPLFGPNLYY